jgi:hypothetical protein
MLNKLLSLALLLLLSSTGFAQKGRATPNVGIRPRPCFVVSVPQEPRLDDFNTYRDYAAMDSVYMGFENVNEQWVQGRVFLQAQASFVGLVDANSTHYVEPFEGTTPIAGGHAFTADWNLVVSVDGNDGLVVQSPYGNWVQHEAYVSADETAVVKIANQGGRLYYYLNDVMVFSQAAPDLEYRDVRAYYFGDFAEPLIGVAQRECDLLEGLDLVEPRLRSR